MADAKQTELRVAIAGLGSIGWRVARELDRGIAGLVLSAVAVREPGEHRDFLSGLRVHPVVLPIERLWEAADIVVECAPSQQLRMTVEPVVTHGKTAVVLSAGALLDNEDLVELAKAHGGKIVVPTGALIGLDAVTAAASGIIHSVRMVTRKPTSLTV